jgi:hypothetical protein
MREYLWSCSAPWRLILEGIGIRIGRWIGTHADKYPNLIRWFSSKLVLPLRQIKDLQIGRHGCRQRLLHDDDDIEIQDQFCPLTPSPQSTVQLCNAQLRFQRTQTFNGAMIKHLSVSGGRLCRSRKGLWWTGLLWTSGVSIQQRKEIHHLETSLQNSEID